MQGQQINPRLIQALTGRELDSIPLSPTYTDLNGKYVKVIREHKKQIKLIYPKNEYILKCNSCGKKRKYNVGLVVVNPESKKDNFSKNLQFTGYFRCKNCNAAGNWEDSTDILFLTLGALAAPKVFEDRCLIGINRMYDGSEYKYITDAEERLLDKIEKDASNGFLWNRLGNLYHGGARPELAVAAFEKSLMIDANQTESHFILGKLLVQAEDYENAAYHFRQMMLTAEQYLDMEALRLRDILADGISTAFKIYLDTEGKIPFIPSIEELKNSGKDLPQNAKMEEMDLDIIPDKLSSFYPIAEMYLGKRLKEIPKRKQTLKLSSKKSAKKKV